MADGMVKIDVQLVTSEANDQAKLLKGTLEGVDIKADAAQHVKELDKSLDEAAKQAKQTADSSKQLDDKQKQAADGAKKLSEEEKKAADEAKKSKAAQDNLKSSLESQSKYWDELADGQEKAGLATASGVSKFNSLKAQLASTTIETNAARAKFEALSSSEGENSEETKKAENAYLELAGKQKSLSLQVDSLGKKFGGLTPQMAQAADKAKAVGDRFQSAGEKLSAVGSKMTIGVTAPIVAGLAYAGKAAVDFDSQIQSMGSLLDDGTVSAKTLKAELAHLGEASKKWSVQYGTSTSDINNGMSELIKKGYSYNQVLGAMPSILDAAKASGDDFNSVMSVSTSTLEQFGLKSNNTAQMLKNTQRVTDSLTFVANKTSAGFSDMGNAMEYVGPVAHGLNMSLEQTASMIGLMSNQGIEGEKAGTALRGALSALLTPSKQNIVGFKALGVSVSDFKKGALTMPQMLDNIREKSKGMTKQQLQSNLALAFGTEAQTGMNILVNEGGDALRNLTGETEKSTGYTKKLAETMNNTSKANVDKFKASLNTLAITFGSKLLPQITQLVKKGTDLVKWFSDLDDGTQKAVLNTALALAAGGPLLSFLGKTTSGIGSLFHSISKANMFLGKFTPGFKTANEVVKKTGETAASGAPKLGLLGKGAGVLGVKIAGMTGATVAAEGGMGALLGSLAPLLPAFAGVATVVGIGIFAWEKWGKAAVASAARTDKWGSDIGATADHAATKFEGFETKVTTSLNDTTSSAKQNATDIDSAFEKMLSSASSNVKKAQVELSKVANDFGGGLGKDLLAGGKSTQNSKNDALADMVSYYNQVQSIIKQAMTADVQAQIEAFHKSDQYRQMDANSRKTADAVLLNHEKDYLTQTLGLTEKQAAAVLKSAQSQKKASDATAVAINGLTGKVKKAAADWNAIVLDPKTGELKTNSKEAVAAAVKDKDKWNSIKLLEQKGKMSTNATVEVAKGLASGNEWNKFKWLIQNAKLNDQTKVALGSAMVSNGAWNHLDWKVAQQLAVNKTAEATIKSVADMGAWNGLTAEQKNLLARSKTKAAAAASLKDVGQWNSLPQKVKDMLAVDKASKPAKSATGSVDKYEQRKDHTVHENAVDNASGPAKKAKNGVDAFSKGKSVITKTLNVVANFGKGVMKALGLKGGTSSFGGGLAMINDATGSNYRELVHLPNSGATFAFKERNVILPLPRGAQVVTAQKSKPILDSIPHFAAGTPGGLNDLISSSGILNITPEMASSFQPVQSEYTLKLSAGADGSLKTMSDTLQALAMFVQDFVQSKGNTPDVLQIQTVANFDPRAGAREMAQPMQVELNRINRTNSRKKGIR